MRAKNPFTPSFGQVPPIMAGREPLVNSLIGALENGVGDPNLSTILVGARGTGKTALMSAVCGEAAARGWICASVSAVPGMLQDILERTVEEGSHLLSRPDTKRLKAVTLGQLGGLEWENFPASAGNWRTRMNGIFKELAKSDTGLLITIDELRVDLDEMIQFATVYQHFVREQKKVAVIMAGLPHQVSLLLASKSASFLRRARRHRLGRVADFEVRDALERTIVAAGRTIEAPALDLAVEAAAGFPFMMQLVGFRIWAINPADETITLQDAQRGVGLAKKEFEEGVLETTYAELSKGDARFLRALVECGGTAALSDVAERMGVASNYAAQYKRRLLEQGIIGERPGGSLAFDMPFFGDYLAAVMG